MSSFTIRNEDESKAVFNLRSAVYWRVKVQLQLFPTVSYAQYQEIVSTAVRDVQLVGKEVLGLYTGIEAHQNAGWKALDCFDRVAQQAAAGQPPAQAAPPPAPQGSAPAAPAAGTPQPPRQPDQLDGVGKDLDKGIKEFGSAIEGFFGKKKKK